MVIFTGSLGTVGGCLQAKQTPRPLACGGICNMCTSALLPSFGGLKEHYKKVLTFFRYQKTLLFTLMLFWGNFIDFGVQKFGNTNMSAIV